MTNLLFIFSDQHAQKVAGCYGDEVVHTPNIDRIAREGLRFDNAYCPSPICVPSRMSMLTARWPHSQECWANDDMLRSDLPTWLHAAGAAGVKPALIGRLHTMGPDQMHGYTQRLVGDHSPNWAGIPRHSMGVLEGTNEPASISLDRSGAGVNAYQVKDRDVTDEAVKWLHNDAVSQMKSGNPFCLTVGYMSPHPPYVADAEAFALYDGKVPDPRLDAARSDNHPFHAWWRKNRGIADVSKEHIARARAAYWALVHRMDEMIGELLSALEAIGELDNTLIVYASDHGDHLGERGLWWKHTFFEESAKVPMVMRLPGILPAGETRAQIVNLIDLSQTMLEAIGAEQLPNADGKSFWSVAKNATTPWNDETFSEYCTDTVPDWTGKRAVQQRMIRSGCWKLITYDNAPPQLFNLDTDPDETVNLADHPEHSVIYEQLLQKIGDGWNDKEIAQRMRERRKDKDVLAAWAKETKPPSTHVWDFEPDLNTLEGFPCEPED